MTTILTPARRANSAIEPAVEIQLRRVSQRGRHTPHTSGRAVDSLPAINPTRRALFSIFTEQGESRLRL
jgi:hypothetical protein